MLHFSRCARPAAAREHRARWLCAATPCIWGFDDNFTNYDFRKYIEFEKHILPERKRIKGFSVIQWFV